MKGMVQDSREEVHPSNPLADQHLARNLGIPKDRNSLMVLTPLLGELPLDSKSNWKLAYVTEKVGCVGLKTSKKKTSQNVG